MHPIDVIEDATSADIALWLEKQLVTALQASPGEIAISMPGGSTPFPILEAITPGAVDWSRIAVWPGDDRLVPEDHPASNVGRIRALLEPLGARIVPLVEDAVPPHFALTWLGMGADGHVASLFPSTRPRADDRLKVRRITPNPLPPEAPFDRVSLTIPALVDSDQLLFVVRGEKKRALFEAGMRREHDLPVAHLLAAVTCPVTCFT